MIRQNLRKTAERVTEARTCVSDIEDTQKTNNTDITELLRTVKSLELRVEDAEGQSRQNNLCIVGIPEGSEGANPTTSVRDWLRSWVPTEMLSACFIRKSSYGAHSEALGGAPPRPFIARLSNYADRDVVLRAARLANRVECKGDKVMIFPDYTMWVQQQRRAFLAVKEK